MFQVLDPLINFNCPHCDNSLRWKSVSKKAQIKLEHGLWPYHCPHCDQIIVERRHPAHANNWRWSVFYLPGVLLCALGIFVPSLGWLLPYAVFVLFAGLIALVIYMIKERLGWNVYIPLAPDS